ncbi:MAG: hypothetical protein K1X55_12465 [Chitinophagales bacterium]|nr:hypothetical protein [Chitinophagales bacterium]
MSSKASKSLRIAVMAGVVLLTILVILPKGLDIYWKRYSPIEKQRWENVENSYKIKIGDDYERVLEIMGKKPDISHHDSLLTNKIVDPYWFRSDIKHYLGISYFPPHNTESGIKIIFDTNFVISKVLYYKDEHWHYPRSRREVSN